MGNISRALVWFFLIFDVDVSLVNSHKLIIHNNNNHSVSPCYLFIFDGSLGRK